MTSEILKTIPTSISTEKWLIGACMAGDAEALYAIAGDLKPDDFRASTWTSKVFRAIVFLVQENRPVEMITVENRLREMNLWNDIPGGRGQLEDCVNGIASTKNYQYHIYEQIEFSQRWHFYKLSREIGEMAADPTDRGKPEKIIDFLGSRLVEISQRKDGEVYKSIHKAGQLMIDHIDQVRASDGKSIDRIESFSPSITGSLGGGYTKGLTLLSGPGGVGKTTFILNEAAFWAEQGLKVCFSSLEMKLKRLAFMYYSALSRIAVNDIENARFDSEKEADKLVRFWMNSSTTDFFIDDQQGLTVDQIIIRAKMMRAMGKLDVLVVDSLKAIVWDERYGMNKKDVWEKILNKLRVFANNEGVWVILIHHIKKGTDGRPGHRDLQYIDGDIPDLVAFLFSAATKFKMDQFQGFNEFSVPEKNRGGPAGVNKVLRFQPEFGLYRELESIESANYWRAMDDIEGGMGYVEETFD